MPCDLSTTIFRANLCKVVFEILQMSQIRLLLHFPDTGTSLVYTGIYRDSQKGISVIDLI